MKNKLYPLMLWLTGDSKETWAMITIAQQEAEHYLYLMNCVKSLNKFHDGNIQRLILSDSSASFVSFDGEYDIIEMPELNDVLIAPVRFDTTKMPELSFSDGFCAELAIGTDDMYWSFVDDNNAHNEIDTALLERELLERMSRGEAIESDIQLENWFRCFEYAPTEKE